MHGRKLCSIVSIIKYMILKVIIFLFLSEINFGCMITMLYSIEYSRWAPVYVGHLIGYVIETKEEKFLHKFQLHFVKLCHNTFSWLSILLNCHERTQDDVVYCWGTGYTCYCWNCVSLKVQHRINRLVLWICVLLNTISISALVGSKVCSLL
jgi:hypothetical protein